MEPRKNPRRPLDGARARLAAIAGLLAAAGCLIAACSDGMYTHAGRPTGHRNCSDNLRAALAPHGIALPFTPSPWNLFMIAAVPQGKAIDYQRPVSKPGDLVTVRAEMDCIFAVSACPDDVYPTNGGDGTPRDVLLRVGG